MGEGDDHSHPPAQTTFVPIPFASPLSRPPQPKR
jgi:hypothetical protein